MKRAKVKLTFEDNSNIDFCIAVQNAYWRIGLDTNPVYVYGIYGRPLDCIQSAPQEIELSIKGLLFEDLPKINPWAEGWKSYGRWLKLDLGLESV